ncbi:MAG: glycosyltransferase [Polyangia bacterium]
MDAPLPLAGYRFCISGSAGDTSAGPVDRALLRRCHAFVSCLAISILRAGGELVTFVGDEPMLEPGDTMTAKVFYWTQLEAVASYLATREATHTGRPLLYAVASLDPQKTRIPASRKALWDQLLAAEGAVDVGHIPERGYVGHHHRERQAERGDVLITLGGGKGVFEQVRMFRNRGRAIIPLDPPIGCSSNDGEASPELNREALAEPAQFVPPALATWFVSQLSRLSFSGETPPEELAQRMMQVLVRVAPALAAHPTEPSEPPSPRPDQSIHPPQGAAFARSMMQDRLHFLVVADEWRPYRGGISTFNRSLCLALARAGHRISLFIPRKSLQDNERAEISQIPNITLVSSKSSVLTDERELLQPPVLSGQPDVIIGHDAITGPAANSHRDHFGRGLLVHFIHVSPRDAEYEKGKPWGEAMVLAQAKAREQAELAAKADRVVALGPLLARSIRSSLHEWKHRAPVHEMLPWLEDVELLPPPEERACLFLGRAESFHLKGLKIAVGAVSRLGERSRLLVRGATQADAEKLHGLLAQWGHSGIKLHLQEYTVDQRAIDASFRAATAVIMPSRIEGFGLAGLEAISRGIPVRVSGQSGLGEVIKQYGRELGLPSVVDFIDEAQDEENSLRLHEKLAPLWADPTAAFDQARRLREALRPHLDEGKSIAAFIDALRTG